MKRIRTLALLVAAYMAATWIPGPGLAIRDLSLGSVSLQIPQLLLAGLLFTGGLCSSHDAVRTVLRLRLRFCFMALAAWGLPLVAASMAVWWWWGIWDCPPSVALGILIVAAMPIANSSIGWSTSLGGSVAMSIALLVCGTALSPLLAPVVIHAAAVTVGATEQTLTQTPWNQGMRQFFLVWVLMPVLLGMLVAGQLTAERSRRVRVVAKRVSFAIVIALNYLNGAACLPELTAQPLMLLWPLVAASSSVLLAYLGGLGVAIVLPPGAKSNPQESDRTSLLLAVVMRNTGAALVFAGSALPQFALVSISIITYTLLQHLWVGLFMERRSRPQPSSAGKL